MKSRVQRKPEKPNTAGDKVLVACRLPGGLNIRIFKEIEEIQAGMHGLATVKKWIPVVLDETKDNELLGHVWHLNGYNPPRLKGSERPKMSALNDMENLGYSLTWLDREVWDTYVKQNKDSLLIKNKIVFASDSQDAADKGIENVTDTVKCGFEEMDPDKLPRQGFSIGDNSVQTATEQRNLPRKESGECTGEETASS